MEHLEPLLKGSLLVKAELRFDPSQAGSLQCLQAHSSACTLTPVPTGSTTKLPVAESVCTLHYLQGCN